MTAGTARVAAPADDDHVDADTFRSALAAHPAGVVVITAQDADGPHGLTATSFVSLSLEPALVGFAVNAASSTWQRLRRVDTLVVHLLEERQHAIASRFATRDVDRFAAPTRWARLSTGEPLLSDVGTWMRCALERRVDLGDHVLVVARVLQATVEDETAPLLYHQRGYRSLRDLV